MLDKAGDKTDRKEPVVVKKYANRRLYNTETSTYVTLDDLASMVKEGRDFVVYDAKAGDDLTHAVLTQIIVEQESIKGGQSLLPVPFLRQLIRFYGDSVEKMVPSYLTASLDILTKEQERFRKQFTAFTPQGAFEAYQDQARKNLTIFETAMSTMFKPFNPAKPYGDFSGAANANVANATADQAGTPAAEKATEKPNAKSSDKSGSKTSAGKPATSATTATDDNADVAATKEMAEMRAQLAAMQSMIDKLARDKS